MALAKGRGDEPMTAPKAGFGWRAFALPLAALTLLAQACALAWPLALLWLLDVVVPGGERSSLLWLSLAFLALALLGMFADWGRRRLANRLALSLAAKAGRRGFSALIETTGGAGADGLLAAMPPSQRAAAVLAGLDAALVWAPLGVMYLLGGWLAAIPASACLVIAAWAGVRAKSRAATLREIQAAEDERLDLSSRLFSHIHVVKALGVAEQAVQAVAATLARLAPLDVKNLRLAARSAAANALLERAALVATIVYGFLLLESDALTPGGFAACLALGFLAVKTTRKHCESPPRIKGRETGGGKKALVADASPQEGLVLTDVGWRHPATGEDVVSEASLALAPGSCVAILGAGGADASRLLEVMAGRVRPDRGAVRFNGVDLRAADVEDKIVLVSADACLFEGTLADNLSGFSTDLRPEALALARELGVEAWAGGWKQGLQTKLRRTANDEALSPGRRQQICLARALALAPSILLLDHVDRHLDAGALRRLVACLKQRKGRLTLVLVSDNPDMLALADDKLVLEGGKLFGPEADRPAASALRSRIGVAAQATAKARGIYDDDEELLSDPLEQAKKAALSMLALSLAAGSLAAFPALLLLWLANGAPTGEGQAATTPLALAAGLAPLLLAELLLRKAWSAKLIDAFGQIDGALPLGVFKRLMALPLAALEAATASRQIAVLRQIERWRNPYWSLQLASAVALAELAPLLALLFYASAQIAALTLGFLAVFALVARGLAKGRRQALALAERSANAEAAYVLETAMASSAPPKERLHLQFAARQDKQIEAQAAWLATGAPLWTLSSALRLLSQLGFLWLGGTAMQSADMSHAALLASLLALLGLFEGLEAACAGMDAMAMAASSFAQCVKALKLKGEDDGGNLLKARDWDGGVDLSNLCLRYPGDKNFVVDKVDLKVSTGEILAVAGVDGSGKSTLLKLMLGLYPPQTGGVFANGIRLDLLGKRSLRRQTAYLPATPFVFPGSVADNLRLGNPQASIADLERAAANLGILGEIRDLQDGFDTLLCEADFSWSLLRKIELARLDLSPAVLFLLDEPSQGLDPPSREALAALLRRLKTRAAVVLATRDDSLVRLADEVGIMERGRLTHARIQPQSNQSEGEAT